MSDIKPISPYLLTVILLFAIEIVNFIPLNGFLLKRIDPTEVQEKLNQSF